MADLGGVLGQMLSATGASIFQATVDAVGVGVVTIHLNGGTFTDVPYIPGGFFPAFGPAVDDPCYVLAQRNWGMLVIGKPAPGPGRAGSSAATYLWEPTATGTWFFDPRASSGNGFTASVNQTIFAPEDNENQAVWFYQSGNPVPLGHSLASAGLKLTGSWTPNPDVPSDWDYVEIGLHNSAPTASGQLNRLTGLSQSNRFPSTFGPSYYPIPLDWVNRLIAGTAKGLYIATIDVPLNFTGSGELQLVTL